MKVKVKRPRYRIGQRVMVDAVATGSAAVGSFVKCKVLDVMPANRSKPATAYLVELPMAPHRVIAPQQVWVSHRKVWRKAP